MPDVASCRRCSGSLDDDPGPSRNDGVGLASSISTPCSKYFLGCPRGHRRGCRPPDHLVRRMAGEGVRGQGRDPRRLEPETRLRFSHWSSMSGAPNEPANRHVVDITLEDAGDDTGGHAQCSRTSRAGSPPRTASVGDEYERNRLNAPRRRSRSWPNANEARTARGSRERRLAEAAGDVVLGLLVARRREDLQASSYSTRTPAAGAAAVRDVEVEKRGLVGDASGLLHVMGHDDNGVLAPSARASDPRSPSSISDRARKPARRAASLQARWPARARCTGAAVDRPRARARSCRADRVPRPRGRPAGEPPPPGSLSPFFIPSIRGANATFS